MPRTRAFLLWLIMLAVPFQGYAAMSMVFCATQEMQTADVSAHAGAKGDFDAQGGDHPLGAAASVAHEHGSHSHDVSDEADTAHKCGTCGACHAVALLPSAVLTASPLLPQTRLVRASRPPAPVALHRLDRPPQG